MRERVHVGKLGGYDESIVSHEGSACGPDSLFAVVC